MKTFLALFLGFSITVFAQKTDYNTKDGAIINGYDVVAYFSKMPKKGNNDFSAKHDGATFYFSSNENLETFKQDPEKYVPQYGGYCAYAIAKKKTKMYIDPEVYEIRDGKLYLFYSSWFGSKLSNWQNGNTKKLQTKGDKNWEKLKYVKK